MVKRLSSNDRQSRLDAIRKKLASTDFGGGSRNYWKPKVGRNTIRILPAVDDMGDFFWVDVGKHFLQNNKTYICPEFTLGEPCPICEFVKELYSAGDAESKTLAGNIGRRKQFWMNIIDRDNEDAGVQLFTPGALIFKAIASIIGDPDYGDIFDEDDGTDIVITRTGLGRTDTRYEVMARRKSSPLSHDPDLIDKWIESALDLSPVELSDDPEEDASFVSDKQGTLIAPVAVMPYARIKEEFEGSDVDKEEEDVDETHPFPNDDTESVRATIRRRRTRRSRR